MQQEPLSDDDIIAQEQRSYRKRMRAAIIFALAFWPAFAVAIIASWGYLGPLINSSGIAGVIFLYAPLVLVVLAVFALRYFMKWRYPIPEEATTERILRKQIDEHQTRGRWVRLLLLLVLLQSTYNAARHPYFLGPGASFFSWETDITFLFLVGAFSLIACFGAFGARKRYYNAINDELTRSLRVRAVRLGYLALMAALCATYLAILYQPTWATLVLPFVMFIGVAVPLIYFQILEWQAGRTNSSGEETA